MRLLLVEDDFMIGESLQKALRKSGYIVNWVTDGETAETTLKDEKYDLIILDLGLPKKSGMSVLEDIRNDGNDIPVLILTAKDSTSDKVRGLDAGADDYLLKPFELEELEARLRSLVRRHIGQSGNDAGKLRHGKVALDPKTHEALIGDKRTLLSAKEFTLFQTLLKMPTAILSKSQLEESLYGWNEEISSNAVEVHIHQIRKKLGNNIIKNIRNVGYTMGDPE